MPPACPAPSGNGAPRRGAVPRERRCLPAETRAGTAAWPPPRSGDGGPDKAPRVGFVGRRVCAVVSVSRSVCGGFLRGSYGLYCECMYQSCKLYQGAHTFSRRSVLSGPQSRMTRHITYDPVTRVAAGKRSKPLLQHLDVKLFSYIFPSSQLYLESNQITASAV